MLHINTILTGDVIDQLQTLPDQCVQTVVTSPPYWNLRQYLPERTVILSRGLSDEEKQRIEDELKKRGIKPIM